MRNRDITVVFHNVCNVIFSIFVTNSALQGCIKQLCMHKVNALSASSKSVQSQLVHLKNSPSRALNSLCQDREIAFHAYKVSDASGIISDGSRVGEDVI